MKKYIAVLMVTISFPLYAQRFEGGFLAGLNASQIDGDTYAGYYKFGVALGAYTYTSVSEMFDIQFEIKYMGKGARSKPTSYGVDYTNQLDYIEFPLILRYKTPADIGIEFGIGYGYLFNNYIKDIYGDKERQVYIHTSDWLGLFGLNYPLTEKLLVNLRFSYSLLTIKDKLADDIYYVRGRGVYNNVLSVSLYYLFPKKY